MAIMSKVRTLRTFNEEKYFSMHEVILVTAIFNEMDVNKKNAKKNC